MSYVDSPPPHPYLIALTPSIWAHKSRFTITFCPVHIVTCAHSILVHLCGWVDGTGKGKLVEQSEISPKSDVYQPG